MKKLDTKSFALHVEVKSAVPIYEQIKDAIKMAVFSGELKEGEKIVSIREVASQYNINPITIMKAYNQLEQEGLLFSRKGAGYYVQVDKTKFGDGRKEKFKQEISEFIRRITNLGFTIEDFLDELKNGNVK